MLIVYASRTGNVESIVSRMNLETLRVDTGNECVAEDFILFTYTDGYGDIPMEVETFLTGNSMYLKAVAVSGDKGYGEAYCLAGDKIADLYDVECIYKVENAGTEEDMTMIKEAISHFIHE